MRLSTCAAGVFCLPLFASARLGQHHHHNRGHDHGLGLRALEVEVLTVTEIVYHTVTATTSSASISATSTAPAAASSALSPSSGSISFHKLVPGPGSASVKNSCRYPVYIWSVGNESCGVGKECQLIAPNATYTEGLRICKDGGISLKVSKTESAQKPIQFEYSVWATDNKTVSYDISYLDCMNNKNGEKDLSNCAGHEGGIQAVAGMPGDATCPDYQCAAGEWCDVQAYVVAEFDYKPGAPVGSCDVDKGIAFELCAGG